MRKEIVDKKIHLTPKETDIFKIRQSGDLANLDGLDDPSRKLLPSLLELRNAMYSQEFRKYLSEITDSGPLSGKKTDMSINLYEPGSHLLCHDDVIGSRRVSYILYLTDPDNAWQADWGGALRLYPTRTIKQIKGPKIKIPDPDPSLSIPPAWNQLSFFAVQPGESFHDVEEVYSSGSAELDAGRARLAISGWYHIPQEGEDGYKSGQEQDLAASSSLTQLQIRDDFDLPKPRPIPYLDLSPSTSTYSKEKEQLPSSNDNDDNSDLLTPEEWDFLLQFITDDYLDPENVPPLRETFEEECYVRMDKFLSVKFAESLRKEIVNEPRIDSASSKEIEESSPWTVSRPPHKHRYLFMQPIVDSNERSDTDKPDLLENAGTSQSPLEQLVNTLFPSPIFRKYLRLLTGLVLKSHDVKARRFRHGNDYQLATVYEDKNPRLEITLGISPEGKWEADEKVKGALAKEKGKEKESISESIQSRKAEEINNGGHEIWTASDDEDKKETQEELQPTQHDTSAGEGSSSDAPNCSFGSSVQGSVTSGTSLSDQAITIAKPTSTTSTAATRAAQKADPAIYQSSSSTDGNLFEMPAGWNRLSLVLRDIGTLRFVKYVSKSAGADRWDVVGDYEVDKEKTPGFADDEGGEEEEEEEEVGEDELARELEEEEELRGGFRGVSEETTEDEVEEGSEGLGESEDEEDEGDEEEVENRGAASEGSKGRGGKKWGRRRK